jgi:hypothetical protein
VRLVEAEAAEVPGCEQSFCVSTPSGFKICGCPMEDSGDPFREMTVYRGSESLVCWSQELFTMVDATEFSVAEIDIDGDGRVELLVQSLLGASMGMARQFSEVCVIRPLESGAQKDCVDVEDFPVMSWLVDFEDGSPCELLASTWRSGEEPKRGDGLYLVGEWFGSVDGQFVRDTAHPAFARRYLYSFERARGNSNGKPMMWFKDERARILRCPDPLCVVDP